MKRKPKTYTVNIFGAEYEIQAISPADAVGRAAKQAFYDTVVGPSDRVVWADVWETHSCLEDDQCFDSQTFRVEYDFTISTKVELEYINHGC